MKTPTHLALLAAGAFGLALAASSALAQDYNDNDSDNDASYSEQIEVTAPRAPQTDARGFPQEVQLPREVAYDDLDLRTARGARELRARIRYAAHEVCTELDATYPGPDGETQSCYRKALHNASIEADDIIANARGYAYNE